MVAGLLPLGDFDYPPVTFIDMTSVSDCKFYKL